MRRGDVTSPGLACSIIEANGSGGGTRTPDTGIMIPPLYQLSYAAGVARRYGGETRVSSGQPIAFCGFRRRPRSRFWRPIVGDRAADPAATQQPLAGVGDRRLPGGNADLR